MLVTKPASLPEEPMNATWIVAVFLMTDDLMEAVGHHSHVLAQVPDSEIITAALVAAKYFQNHHERALWVMQELHYLSGTLSVSRFNRRLHALADWLEVMTVTVGEAFAQGEVFVIDSLPVPVCRRARARRCRKVRGRVFCGDCAAKEEKFFGWRLHLICNAVGQPVSFQLVPGGYHDLTAVHELAFVLPRGARTFSNTPNCGAAIWKLLLPKPTKFLKTRSPARSHSRRRWSRTRRWRSGTATG
jgi:hypothetical protein